MPAANSVVRALIGLVAANHVQPDAGDARTPHADHAGSCRRQIDHAAADVRATVVDRDVDRATGAQARHADARAERK